MTGWGVAGLKICIKFIISLQTHHCFFCTKLQISLSQNCNFFNGFLCIGTILQITGETVGEVKAVADMHQRKAEMAKHSDAFIALPG